MAVTLAEHSDAAAISVELSEYEHVGPAQNHRLNGVFLKDNLEARRLADRLRPRVVVADGYHGLEITSTSFVGHVDVGGIHISIRPKLPAMPLVRLLRFTYRLRDLAISEETIAPVDRHGLQDVLVSLLAAEIEELIYRGLPRNYLQTSEKLASPRGNILLKSIIRQGGVLEAKLPCQYFERQANWHLNRVLRAGLDMGARMAEDRDLRRQVQQLSQRFVNVEPVARVDENAIDQATRELTRLTEAARPALTLISLLQDQMGTVFGSADQSSRTPGFLFDMNAFFQRLLSRFLHDHLPKGRIADEWSIRNLFSYAANVNPKKRIAPTLRPDFAVLYGDRCQAFLDAKYRDVWAHGFDPSWLYQLSMYALAAPRRMSVMLYATMAGEASDEQIDISPGTHRSDAREASVILRPVSLLWLADLISSQRKEATMQRCSFADHLIGLKATKAQFSAA